MYKLYSTALWLSLGPALACVIRSQHTRVNKAVKVVCCFLQTARWQHKDRIPLEVSHFHM